MTISQRSVLLYYRDNIKAGFLFNDSQLIYKISYTDIIYDYIYIYYLN
jgi:hypothetical protein